MHTSKVPVRKQEFTYKLKQLDPAEKLIFWISPLGRIIYYCFFNFFNYRSVLAMITLSKKLKQQSTTGKKENEENKRISIRDKLLVKGNFLQFIYTYKMY